MEAHPEHEDRPEAGSDGHGPVIAALVIGTIFLILVVLHLTVGMSPHGT
jgi:hypothetical protein